MIYERIFFDESHTEVLTHVMNQEYDSSVCEDGEERTIRLLARSDVYFGVNYLYHNLGRKDLHVKDVKKEYPDLKDVIAYYSLPK